MVNQTSVDSSDSRAKILEAARIEFAEKGFDGARVDSIARRANLNKALIYYYFKSKDELLEELLRVFLEERKLGRDSIPRDGQNKDLPHRLAQFDVDFLFQRRDVLRIALMEDLKSSKDGIPGPGTLLKHWLEGLGQSREAYSKEGYGFRYTPRVMAAMYFFHMMPTMAFCTMGETLAKAIGIEPSVLREEFLKLVGEINTQQFHSVFGQSCTDSQPEVSLPGIVPRPPSETMVRVFQAFRPDELYSAEKVEAILSEIADPPGELFAKLVEFRQLKMDGRGRFRWVGQGSESVANVRPPQEHLKTSPEQRAKLVAKHMPNGRLEAFPIKEKARLALIEHISELFHNDRTYSEKQVDEILKKVVDDHTKARRYLIDYQYLHRKPDGSQYWTWDHQTP